MPATPGNSQNITGAGLVKFDGTATFSAVTTTTHDVLVGAASNGITNVAPSATSGVPLVSGGSSADPSFTTAVVAGGGTGRTTLTNHGVLVGAATAAITQLAAGNAGQVLQSGGASADPAYSTPTYPSASGTAGTILRSDGTNNVYSTNTYPNTATTGDILYASGSNVIGNLADVATGQVLTSGGVGAVPAYSATPTVTSITFGSGTALSQYVEGTFTPTITGGSTAGSTTYSHQVGYYVRVGRLVTVSAYIQISAATGTGNFQFSALPFTVSSQSNYFPVGVCVTSSSGFAWPASTTMLSIVPLGGQTNALVNGSGSGVAGGNLQMTNSAGQFYYTITYMI